MRIILNTQRIRKSRERRKKEAFSPLMIIHGALSKTTHTQKENINEQSDRKQCETGQRHLLKYVLCLLVLLLCSAAL